jgi:hypothetical protein
LSGGAADGPGVAAGEFGEDHPFAECPGGEHQLVEPERLHDQGGDLGAGNRVAGAELVQAGQAATLAGGGRGQVAGHHVEGLTGQRWSGLAVDAGEVEGVRRGWRLGQRPGELAQVAEGLGGGADDLVRVSPDALGERSEQGERVDPEGDQLLGEYRVRPHKPT